MAGIRDYSSTAASNTSVGGVSVAEGMNPSAVNNAYRAGMADLADWRDSLAQGTSSGTVGGTADAITLTITPAFTAYAVNNRFIFKASGPNTVTNPTLNVSSLGAKTIKTMGGGALQVGAWATNDMVLVTYDGTDMIVLSMLRFGDLQHPVNAQTGTSYTVVTGDRGKLVTYSNASAIAVTLPQANSTTFSAGWFHFAKNKGAGTVTVTPTTSTIGGASTLTLRTLEWALIVSDGTNYQVLVGTDNISAAKWPLGTLHGLTLSYVGTTTYGVATGTCSNEDGGTQYDMTLSSAFTKTLSSWAAGTGNGSLDTGAVANTTWYHVFLIRKTSDGTIDVLLSTSATSPTMPSGYVAFRRLGSILTNGSAQIVSFIQTGDTFRWDVAVQDVNATNPGTSAVTRTLSVPTGVKVFPVAMWRATAGTSSFIYLLVSDLAGSDNTATASRNNLTVTNNAQQSSTIISDVPTNTSAQVRSRISNSGASDVLVAITHGWIDNRGKNF